MTTPNYSTNGAITPFTWKLFPVEEDKFDICLVQSGKTQTRDFSRLYEYIKVIFPEDKSINLNNPEDHISTKFTIIKEFDQFNYENKWIESHILFKHYLENRHTIVLGEFDFIPETSLTNSRIIIFESQDDSNKYLNSRHRASLQNFDILSNFIVIDKSVMGHINIYGLNKKDLIRYDKDLQS